MIKLPEPSGYRIKTHGSVHCFVVREDVARERADKLIEQFGDDAITVDAVHTEAKLKQAVRDAYEDAAKTAEALTAETEATTYADVAAVAIRALIKEIPE
jgi:ketosteroid isomerase-like protein